MLSYQKGGADVYLIIGERISMGLLSIKLEVLEYPPESHFSDYKEFLNTSKLTRVPSQTLSDL